MDPNDINDKESIIIKMNETIITSLEISTQVSISLKDIAFIHSPEKNSRIFDGNKSSAAVNIIFDIKNSSLPIEYKEKLLLFKDYHIDDKGIITIKSQSFTTEEENSEDAILRLVSIIQSACTNFERPTN